MAKSEEKLPTQVVGNAGLYYVCYRLSLRGWNAMPTARNARGIDILAYSADGKRKVSIQVKALSKRNPVPLGTHFNNLIADFVVVVVRATIAPPSAPSCFVMTPDEVIALAHTSKDGKSTRWLQPPEYEGKDFHEAWSRIGSGGEQLAESPINEPSALAPA